MAFLTAVYEQIKSDLGYLKLDAAAGAFAMLAEQAKLEDWSHIEFLAHLIAEQATADRDRRLAARLRYARFPYRRTIEDFDYEFQPSVDRKLMEDLATLRFIDENRPILFLGQPGCGTTHLAVVEPVVREGLKFPCPGAPQESSAGGFEGRLRAISCRRILDRSRCAGTWGCRLER